MFSRISAPPGGPLGRQAQSPLGSPIRLEDQSAIEARSQAAQRRARRGETPRTLPPPGRNPRLRAARLRPVPAKPGQGHQPSVARAGGGGRGLRRRDGKGRSQLLHLSRSRPYAGARRADGKGAGRADAARQRPDARQGRLDAPDLGRARRDGLLRHHRRASADRLRRRLARAIQGRRRTSRSASSATAPPISAPSTRR